MVMRVARGHPHPKTGRGGPRSSTTTSINWRRPFFSPFNVFRYITVRTVYASLTAMFLAFVFGPWLIKKLRDMQIGQYIREEGPQAHQKKKGTPTMGGVLIVLW